jgi:hypothetical protein
MVPTLFPAIRLYNVFKDGWLGIFIGRDACGENTYQIGTLRLTYAEGHFGMLSSTFFSPLLLGGGAWYLKNRKEVFDHFLSSKGSLFILYYPFFLRLAEGIQYQAVGFFNEKSKKKEGSLKFKTQSVNKIFYDCMFGFPKTSLFASAVVFDERIRSDSLMSSHVKGISAGFLLRRYLFGGEFNLQLLGGYLFNEEAKRFLSIKIKGYDKNLKGKELYYLKFTQLLHLLPIRRGFWDVNLFLEDLGLSFWCEGAFTDKAFQYGFSEDNFQGRLCIEFIQELATAYFFKFPLRIGIWINAKGKKGYYWDFWLSTGAKETGLISKRPITPLKLLKERAISRIFSALNPTQFFKISR